MRQDSIHIHRAPTGVVAFALMITALFAGCGSSAGTAPDGKPGGDTPEQAYANLHAALSAGDYALYFRCLAPKTQTEVLMQRVMQAVHFHTMDDEQKAAYPEEFRTTLSAQAKLLGEHGVNIHAVKDISPGTQPTAGQVEDALGPVSDRAALFAAFQNSAPASGDDPTADDSAAMPRVTNVTITGNQATGKLVIGEREQQIQFTKVGSRWFVVVG